MTAAFQDDLAAAAVDAEFTGSSRLVDYGHADYDRVLVVDVANLAYRSAYGNPDLATSDGRRSGHVFGSLRTLVTAFEKNLPAGRWLLVRCHEGPGAKDWRRQFLPGYKTRPERWNPVTEVREAFYALPGLDLELAEHEGDDAVISAVDFFRDKVDTWVWSGDKDLWSLVGTAKVWSPNLGRLVTKDDVWKEFKLRSPERLPLLKAICGDSSDTIQGVDRFRKAVAAEAVDSLVVARTADLSVEAALATLLTGKLSDATRAKLVAATDRVVANFKVTQHRRFHLPQAAFTRPQTSVESVLRSYECKSLEKWGKALAGEADFTVYGEVDA